MIQPRALVYSGFAAVYRRVIENGVLAALGSPDHPLIIACHNRLRSPTLGAGGPRQAAR